MPAQTESRVFRVLTFRLASVNCAIRSRFVDEIISLPATVSVPGQPPILEGFLNLRGGTVPVVRLASLFGLPVNRSLYSPVILTRHVTGPIGWLVDAVDDIASLNGADLRPIAPGHAVNECAEGEFSVGESVVVLLDFNRVLLAEENRRISELQNKAMQRLADIGAAEP